MKVVEIVNPNRDQWLSIRIIGEKKCSKKKYYINEKVDIFLRELLIFLAKNSMTTCNCMFARTGLWVSLIFYVYNVRVVYCLPIHHRTSVRCLVTNKG